MVSFADQVPFREELVDLSTGDSPPYLDNALVDWSLIFNKHDVQVHCNGLRDSPVAELGIEADTRYRWPVSYFNELLRRRVDTTLDETQLNSIRNFLENRVTLIQVCRYVRLSLSLYIRSLINYAGSSRNW